MSRLTDAILGKGQGYDRVSTAPMVNVGGTAAGQMGILTDLRGFHSNSAYVRRNVICVVMNTPRGFRDLPEPEMWQQTCKALHEIGAKTIDGLNATLNVEFVSNPIGAAGEQQEDIAKVNRERSVPVFTFTEKYGKPINRFYDGWIRYLMNDPETGIPAVVTLPNADGPTDLLPDYTGMTCMFIEPDPLHKTVVEAWLITNMMPNTAGTVNGSRDITAPGTTVDYSIQFTGIQQVGAGVIALAQRLLDTMTRTGVNPNTRQAFIQEISADVARGTQGYKEVMSAVAGQQIG